MQFIKQVIFIFAFLVACSPAAIVSADSAGDSGKKPQTAEPPQVPVAAPAKVRFSLPAEKDIPPGPQGEAIRFGEQLIRQTQVYAKAYVGNGLNCTNCHLDAGTTPYAMTYVGLPAIYPLYRSRQARVISLQERVNDCFTRSLNGKPLPMDSEEMNAILSYMAWLSKGVPVGSEVEERGVKKLGPPESPPDPVRGKKLFLRICARCHGQNGQGKTRSTGEYEYPPLWGDKAFNIGAGMARLNTASAFIKANMPLGQGESLTAQQAYDIAAYFTTQPRPDFAGKAGDWPKGGKPGDARY